MAGGVDVACGGSVACGGGWASPAHDKKPNEDVATDDTCSQVASVPTGCQVPSIDATELEVSAGRMLLDWRLVGALGIVAIGHTKEDCNER